MLTIIKRLFKFGLWLCKWCLMLLVAALLAAGVYLYTQLDNEIRQHAEQVLGRHYRNLVVTVRGARLVENRGIELRGLTLVDPHAAGGPETMVAIDAMFLACDTSLSELLQGKTVVRQIKIRHPKLRAICDASGTWNVASLLPLPQLGDNMPVVVIEDAVVELVDASKAPDGKLTLYGVDITVTPEVALSPGAPPTTRRHIRAKFSTEFSQQFDVEGTLDPETGQFHLKGIVAGLEIRPELRQALPAVLAAHLDNLASLEGNATVDFDVSYNPNAEVPLRFTVNTRLERGRLEDPRLPYPLTDLTDLTAEIVCTDQSITLINLSANSGQSVMNLSGSREGYAPDSPWFVEGSIHRVALERQRFGRLFQALPGSLDKLWNKFQPAGVVDVERLKIGFDGRSWHREIDVRCRDVSCTYEKFPYPLVKTTGTINLNGNHLTLNLVAHTTSQPVAIKGEIDNPGRRFTGEIKVTGRNLTIDENLLLALPSKGQRVVRSLDPAGTIHVEWRGWRNDPNVVKMHTRLTLGLEDCSIRYAKFPYPLSDIRGIATAIDNRWVFKDLIGTNDGGVVTCNGTLTPIATGNRLDLTFVGDNVPLEEELRDALQLPAQRLWRDLKPRGRVNLSAELNSVTGQPTPDIEITIEPQADTVSIEPDFFRYRLEKLSGQVHYIDRHVNFEKLQAEHGRTTLATGGSCDFGPDGSWQLTLKDLKVDRLRADRDLLVALPARLRNAVGKLDPSGPVNMHGWLQFSQGPRRDLPVAAKWGLLFDLHQSNLNCGITLSNVSGQVRLDGASGDGRFWSTGELAIDSLVFLEHQFTDVRGPIWLDERQVLLGKHATQQGAAPRNITAKLYGGTLSGSGGVVLDDVPNYRFDISLSGGELSRFAKESVRGRQKLEGKVSAIVELHGFGSSVHALQGEGEIQVREANIGELPLIVALLGVLRATVPDTTAFKQADMKFDIQGNLLSFSELNLEGNAISLYGKGEMNFDREVNLVFGSVVGRNDWLLPFAKRFIGEASQQFMQIHVRGTLDNPDIRKQILPLLNQTIQQLQIDPNPSGNWRSRMPDPRRLIQSRRDQSRNR